jgi:protein TonB
MIQTALLLLATLPTAPPADEKKPAGVVVQSDFSQIKVRKQPPPPAYPEKARAARIQGVVIVQVTIDPEGVPTQALALEGPKELRPAAELYTMHWRFEPALLNGKPVHARFKVTVPFRLDPK